MVENFFTCNYCDQSDPSIPLLLFKYQRKQYWNYPKHLPILTHTLVQMDARLPGLELISHPGDHS